MPTELRDKLQEALGGVYVLERELGGGGIGPADSIRSGPGKEASGNGKRS